MLVTCGKETLRDKCRGEARSGCRQLKVEKEQKRSRWTCKTQGGGGGAAIFSVAVSFARAWDNQTLSWGKASSSYARADSALNR